MSTSGKSKKYRLTDNEMTFEDKMWILYSVLKAIKNKSIEHNLSTMEVAAILGAITEVACDVVEHRNSDLPFWELSEDMLSGKGATSTSSSKNEMH